MEVLILTCLILVIVLLSHDKIIINSSSNTKKEQNNRKVELPNIIGLSKGIARQSEPNKVNERQNIITDETIDNFDHQTNTNINDVQIPQEELDEVFGVIPDFDEEEEEWSSYGVSGNEDVLASGVTFEELANVGMVIGLDEPDASLQKQTVETIQKIQGTELFTLLENSMHGAAQKIAALLDQNIFSEKKFGSSIMRKNNEDEFDIKAFL